MSAFVCEECHRAIPYVRVKVDGKWCKVWHPDELPGDLRRENKLLCFRCLGKATKEDAR